MTGQTGSGTPSSVPARSFRIVAAIVRRGDDLLLVRQRGPDDRESFWGLPGGVVGADESLEDALTRELREETGLELPLSSRAILAYAAETDVRVARALRGGRDPAEPHTSTAFVFEVRALDGAIACADPDGYVSAAEYVPTAEALARLERLPYRVMREPVVAYLRGESPTGAVWLYRVDADGTVGLVGRTAGAATRYGTTCLLGEMHDLNRPRAM